MARSSNRFESYVLSTTDLMVGLLFIFLIIVFYFAYINSRNAEELRQNAELARILKDVKAENITLAERISELTQEILRLEQEILRLERELAAAQKDLKTAKDKLNSAQADKKEMAERISELTQKIVELEGKLAAAQKDLKTAEDKLAKEKTVTKELRMMYIRVNEARKDLLEKIGQKMKEQGFSVKVDHKRGIIRLPEGKLFDKGKILFSPGGRKNMRIMTDVLRAILPCYVGTGKSKTKKLKSSCGVISHKIEAVFLEGHADIQKVRRPTKDYKDNDELAAKRALEAFKLINADTVLKNLKNEKGEFLFGVSGYGEMRPVCEEPHEECWKLNRRIDLRFMMQAPKIEDGMAGRIGRN